MGRPPIPPDEILAEQSQRLKRRDAAIRFFASSHRIDQLSPRTRLLTVLFLMFIVSQGISGVLMHSEGPGWTPERIRQYYRGDAESTPPADDPFGTAAVPHSIHVGRSYGALLETAHFHLVAMPLILFMVAHLFSMTPGGRGRWAGPLCYGGFAFALLDIAMPFAVRFVSGSFAPVKLVAFIGLEAVLLTLTIWTLLHTVRTLGKSSSSGQGPGQGSSTLRSGFRV